MTFDWFTFVAQIINFLILMALLKKLLLGPLQKVMKDREQDVYDTLCTAEEKEKEAVRKEQEYQTRLKELDLNEARLMEAQREKAEQFRLKELRRIRKEIGEQQQKWEDSLQAQQDFYVSELHRQTIDNISGLLDRLVRNLADRSLEEQAVVKFTDKLKSMSREEVKSAFRAVLDYGDGEFTVLSTFPLSIRKKAEISEILKSLFSEKINIRYKEAPELGFGIEVHADAWKTGWSARVFLEELRSNIPEVFDHRTVIIDD